MKGEKGGVGWLARGCFCSSSSCQQLHLEDLSSNVNLSMSAPAASVCMFTYLLCHSFLQMNQQHLWLSGGKRWGSSRWREQRSSQNSYQKTNIFSGWWSQRCSSCSFLSMLLATHPIWTQRAIHLTTHILPCSAAKVVCSGKNHTPPNPATPPPHHYFSGL